MENKIYTRSIVAYDKCEDNYVMVEVDLYDVMDAYNIPPVLANAFKKIATAGTRREDHAKSEAQDLKESITGIKKRITHLTMRYVDKVAREDES